MDIEFNKDYIFNEMWSLVDAILFINGEDSNYLTAYCEVEEQRANEVKNRRRYKEAINDIENTKNLVGTKMELDANDYYYVNSREFIKWCEDKQIYVVPELKKYFNYQYWLSKVYWSFDEVVMVLLSKNNPPFPNEITNVFEIDDEHQNFANRLMNVIDKNYDYAIYGSSDCHPDKDSFRCFDKNHRNIRECFFKKKDFLQNLKGEMGFVNECTLKNQLTIHSRVIDEYATKLLENKNERDEHFQSKIKKLKEGGENLYNNKVYKGCSIDKIIPLSWALDLISGIETLYFSEQEEENLDFYLAFDFDWLNKRYTNRGYYQSLFDKAYENNQINFLINEEFKDGALSGRLKLVDFINWAKGRNIPIPPELESKSNTVTISATKLPEYTTPYMQLMFDAIQQFNITKDNQPEASELGELIDYLKKRLGEMTEDPNHKTPANKAKMMATFLRLPEKQKGGNISNEKIQKKKKG
jgi:hypothetical protein